MSTMQRSEALFSGRFRARAGRTRRGATLITMLIGMTTLLITLGACFDSGRLYVARRKAQIIADAAAMASAQTLPYTDKAQSAANLILAQYRSAYNSNLISSINFSMLGGSVANGVTVTVQEDVPTCFPGLSGIARRRTSASGTARYLVGGL